MQSPRQEQAGSGPTLRDTFHLLYLAVNGLATCISPLLRTNFGSQALGLNGVLALAILVLYVSAYPSPGMGRYFLCWVVALGLQRARSLWLRFRGRILHSRHDGDSWLTLVFPRIRFLHARLIEPVVALALGCYALPADPWLGRFLVWGTVGLLAQLCLDQHIYHQRIQQLHDAEIEQRAMVERFARRRTY